jgi:flagellin-like hook-associated protein FlgL
VRATASNFGSNLNIIQTRQDFTQNIINTLKSGADKLVVADKNEEGANLLSLQTTEQLGITSLSLASQANQAILKLFP